MDLITWQILVYIQPEKCFFGSGGGLVSRVLGILAFPNGETGGAGQVGLIFVKGEEFVRSGLASDGDVEEIHGTDGQVAGVNGAELVS